MASALQTLIRNFKALNPVWLPLLVSIEPGLKKAIVFGLLTLARPLEAPCTASNRRFVVEVFVW